MIEVKNLSYSFPGKDLYDEISFSINEGEHCAFIGTNGTGKSTLIDMLMHPSDYIFDGSIEIDPNCRIGYVSQFPELSGKENITVSEYLNEPFADYQDKIAAICSEMETAADIEPLLEEYQNVLDAFNAIDGDNAENNITKKLNLAGLSKHKDTLVSNLSGGEFKLIQVIREMLIMPNLIIMDEPDVFLDFDHLNALVDLINTHKGTMLVITHNRYLLNHCFNKILHLENKDIQEFDGRYIEYNFSLLQGKIELQELSAKDDEEIERNTKLVNKLRKEASYYDCAAKGRALTARVSLLERLEARRIKAPFVDIKQPNIKFYDADADEDLIALKVSDYSKSFDDVLLEDVNFEIKSTDKVAIIGPNGSGKTTLLRDIYHNSSDAISFDKSIKTAFLSQNQGEMLNEDNTILDEFLDSGVKTQTEVAALIERYGFKEDMLDHKIANLSGGEKNLLQLAKISRIPANFLILDEPTSHLDLYSQLALEKAIKEYDGAVIMVSHDFYTIINCMDYILLVEDKTIRRLRTRKFRQMIYKNHFDSDYIVNEQKKKELETQISLALKNNNFTLAKELSEQLEPLIKLL